MQRDAENIWNLAEQVESCLKGELSQRTALQVGETPGYFTKSWM